MSLHCPVGSSVLYLMSRFNIKEAQKMQKEEV